MNLQTIQEPKEQAREKLLAYQRQLKRRADVEYEAIAAGYQAMADGYPLISLPEAIATGGWDELGGPRLAIARADRRAVSYAIERPWLTFRAYAPGVATKARSTLRRSVRLSAMPRQDPTWSSWRRGEAIVPLIPADVRPAKGTAKDWFILFEAEWKPIPPVDPVLLRYIGGDLYAVLAQWNLTDLERLVLAGRTGDR